MGSLYQTLSIDWHRTLIWKNPLVLLIPSHNWATGTLTHLTKHSAGAFSPWFSVSVTILLYPEGISHQERSVSLQNGIFTEWRLQMETSYSFVKIQLIKLSRHLNIKLSQMSHSRHPLLPCSGRWLHLWECHYHWEFGEEFTDGHS